MVTLASKGLDLNNLNGKSLLFCKSGHTWFNYINIDCHALLVPLIMEGLAAKFHLPFQIVYSLLFTYLQGLVQKEKKMMGGDFPLFQSLA